MGEEQAKQAEEEARAEEERALQQHQQEPILPTGGTERVRVKESTATKAAAPKMSKAMRREMKKSKAATTAAGGSG